MLVHSVRCYVDVERIHENEQGVIFRIDQRKQGMYHTTIYTEER